MGEIITSESLSRVTYTGINSMHSQKTKPPYIRSARKNRTRKKSAVEEDPRKITQKKRKRKKEKRKRKKREKKERKAQALEKEISISKYSPANF